MDWGEDPDGATPLDEDQRAGLIPAWIATRTELNEAEADNILEARRKWRRRAGPRARSRLTLGQLLDHIAVRDLHRDMYGDVWSWAGHYRKKNTNIGPNYWQVSEAVHSLTEDAKYWFANASDEGVDASACRFHHKLVEIHPFPNGNGRHAREMTDLLLMLRGRHPFTWGSASLIAVSETRRAYIDALQLADYGDYADLEAFVRT